MSVDSYSELTPLHEGLKSVLRDLKHFSDDAGVEFMLGYGSLLGACRHNDIIPWDDDVDVVMFRNDYLKFVDYFRTHDTGNYKLSCLELDDSYALYAKFVRTEGYEDLRNYFTHPEGLSIDIFPLDEAFSKDNLLQKVNEFRIRTIKRAVSSKTKLKNKELIEPAIKHFIRQIFVLPFIPFNNKSLMEKAIRLSQKDSGKNTTDLVFYGTTYPMKREHTKKEYWESKTYLPFGDEKYLVPMHYKEVLTIIYGEDYYKMPPDSVKKMHANSSQNGWSSR